MKDIQITDVALFDRIGVIEDQDPSWDRFDQADADLVEARSRDPGNHAGIEDAPGGLSRQRSVRGRNIVDGNRRKTIVTDTRELLQQPLLMRKRDAAVDAGGGGPPTEQGLGSDTDDLVMDLVEHLEAAVEQ